MSSKGEKAVRSEACCSVTFYLQTFHALRFVISKIT